MIGKIIAAPLKYAGDAWTKFSLANPNYYVPAEFGSAVSKLDYLDEIASGQLTTTSSRVAAQTTAAGLRKEIILKSGMDKSEILKFFGDGDDILAIIDEMDNVVGGDDILVLADKFDDGVGLKGGLDDGLGSLDYNKIVSKKGETRIDHINRHARPLPERTTHGVFNGNPKDVVDKAWANRGSVTSIDDGMGGRIYNIPVENAGYESGFTNTGAKMDHITIITMDGTSDIVTAFPSFGNYVK